MTGLKRRLAETEAQEKLRRDLSGPSEVKRGSRPTTEEILHEALEEFGRKIRRKSERQNRDNQTDLGA
jgi:hypothetical protein